jgi:prepilin-type N-terminal cleavage/methylation domain-containing protein/prepilin-type processing-associated H-X9-DG protein
MVCAAFAVRSNRRAFSLLEILVAITVIAILAALSFSALSRAHEVADRTTCLNNLRQWGAALSLYMQDNDGQIPRRGQGVRPVEIIDRPDDWFNCLPPYLGLSSYQQMVAQGRAPKAGERSIFVCPTAKDLGKPHFLAYGMNMYLSPWIRPNMHRISEIPHPSQLAFLADGPGGWSSTIPSNQDYSVSARHGRCANVVFLDGHVQSLDGNSIGCGQGNATLPDIRWETQTDGINQAHMP